MRKSLRLETQFALGLQVGPHPWISFCSSDVGHSGMPCMSGAVQCGMEKLRHEPG